MKVSVILTSYNHEKFIRKSIESVLSQTFQDFELIIIDDCSLDKSWNIIQEFKDERIIAIREEKNTLVRCFSRVINEIASGDYIAVHHSDDIWEPEKLSKQVDFLNENSKYIAVFTDANIIDEDGNEYSKTDKFYYNIFSKKNRNRYEWLNYFFYTGNCLCHPSVLIRKEAFSERLIDKGFVQIPDFIEWIKICLKHEIYIIQEKLIRFRILNNGKNTSGERPDSKVRACTELFMAYKQYLNIVDKEEFLKVFPEATNFIKGDYFIPEYAFAKICMQEKMPVYTKLFGFQLMFNLFSNEEKYKIIDSQYENAYADFVKMTGKYDIFHVLKEGTFQKATVYFDFGEGYNEDYTIKIDYFLEDKNELEMYIDLEKNEWINKQILKLRLDPLEGLISQCKIIKFLINGEKRQLKPYNFLGDLDGYQIFLDCDPIYEYLNESEDIKNIEFIFEVKRIPMTEVKLMVQQIKDQLNGKFKSKTVEADKKIKKVKK